MENVNYQKIIDLLGKERTKTNIPLAGYTTIKIGGPADLFYEAFSKEDLIKAVKVANENQIPYFVLGLGSNVLVSDSGFKGLVIKNRANKIHIAGLKGQFLKTKKSIEEILVEAESGVLINQLVRFTLDEGIEGLEFFLGQPGTVGGSLWINSHNMRRQKFLGDFIKQAEILTPLGEKKVVSRDYFNFGYDYSIVQKTKDLILSAVFKLIPGNKQALWLKAQAELDYRKESQPVLPSLGCTFKNIRRSDAICLATPNHTTSAGFLIDKTGLKGIKIGNAQISEFHGNFIVNLGDASASDVIKLIKLCEIKIKEKYGIKLEKEIFLLGEFNG